MEDVSTAVHSPVARRGGCKWIPCVDSNPSGISRSRLDFLAWQSLRLPHRAISDMKLRLARNAGYLVGAPALRLWSVFPPIPEASFQILLETYERNRQEC